MLQIPCPWCGVRDETEFAFGGEAHIVRPPDPGAVSDADWAAYLYARENPKGFHYERWQHRHGCRQWFNVMRDTVTHGIQHVYRMGSHPSLRQGVKRNGTAVAETSV